ncbi:iron complex transport system permease protein [Amycolatopsis arida]|uniref:Iron complex transport system permease protein n=1 Tax=Amycolatopsis arida TaxID=587909 RepID=A0A1I5TGF5_9PSEU|nr:iron chelate uptake ABC transporter family permease subunit [Amycolatopsis arida]TDX96103.1 iron complex transport system permease protein [Amycolatopsis arida]SFP82105.1 iron complex transport system permease protein [Amycolatopsis arida]
MSAPAGVSRRAGAVVGGLVLGIAALAVLVIGTGDLALSPGTVVRTLLGQGTKFEYLVVTEQRLPRVLVAVLIGAALGLAGTVFQTLTRNPLGSPDIIGFTVGSATGGLLAILVFGAGALATAGGALAGGLGTALLVGALCGWRGLHSNRLVLIGVGIATVLAGVNAYLLTRARIEDAGKAATWLVGNLAGRSWGHLVPLAAAMLVLVPALLVLRRPLGMLELGEETAVGVGVPVHQVRPALFGLAIALTAVATATAGPVPFVALAAPQIVRRLTRLPGPNLVPSAVLGALLMLAADFVGQRLLPASLLPVGVVTGALGGGYLCWLLLRRR